MPGFTSKPPSHCASWIGWPAVEEFAKTSRVHRAALSPHGASSLFILRGSADKDNGLVNRARSALKG
jgi:hypothetical protein